MGKELKAAASGDQVATPYLCREQPKQYDLRGTMKRKAVSIIAVDVGS